MTLSAVSTGPTSGTTTSVSFTIVVVVRLRVSVWVIAEVRDSVGRGTEQQELVAFSDGGCDLLLTFEEC